MEPYRSVSLPGLAQSVLTAAAVVLVPIGVGAEQGPQQVVQESNEEILALYASDSGGAGSDVSEQVFEVMNAVTSFSGIADAAIEGLCDDSVDDCETFKQVFVDLLRTSSVKKLGRYRADSFEYPSEEIDGQTAIVRTLARFGEDEIELDYHLELTDSGWVITNYVVDGVDTIKNYRKQFTRMLRVSSVNTVIERLERRIKDLDSES